MRVDFGGRSVVFGRVLLCFFGRLNAFFIMLVIQCSLSFINLLLKRTG